MKWCNKFFMGKEDNSKEKRGILVLVGGGIGAPTQAIDSAQIIFDILNAKFDIEKDYIYSLNTNNLPASQDENVDILIEKMLKDSWL